MFRVLLRIEKKKEGKSEHKSLYADFLHRYHILQSAANLSKKKEKKEAKNKEEKNKEIEYQNENDDERKR